MEKDKKQEKKGKFIFNKNKFLWFIIREAILLLLIYAIWYLSLMPINLHSVLFVMMLLICALFTGINLYYSFSDENAHITNVDKSLWFSMIFAGGAGILI